MHIELQEIIVFTAVYVLGQVIIRVARALTRHRAALALQQCHSIHTGIVPRLGGVAVFGGIAISLLIANYHENKFHINLIIALAPIIFVGLVEDAINPVSPRIRIGAILVANLIAMIILGGWLPRIGVPLFNSYMLGLFGIISTIILVTGISNSFNMIDGLNGLSGGIAIMALIAINIIAEKVDHVGMVHLSMIYIAGLCAFLTLNYPRARVFLGDTGAYALGFCISWFGIDIMWHAPNVTAPTFLLILIYPITDMVISILRRLTRGDSPFAADDQHMHHLVFRTLSKTVVLKTRDEWANPLATAIILPCAALPMAIATAFYSNRIVLYSTAAACVAVYVFVYDRLKCRLEIESRKACGLK